MNLAVWAERNGVARVRAYRWFHAGLLAVPAQRVGRLILVNGAVARLPGTGGRRCMRGCRQRTRKLVWIGRWCG
jgi:predicted site-specific integrase-resolvase